jgi:hypothetical protein
MHKDVPADFVSAQDFRKFEVVYWCANRKHLSDWVHDEKRRWSQRDLLLLMKMCVTVVAVAKGYLFTGLK